MKDLTVECNVMLGQGTVERPMLRIVTQNIEDLFKEFKGQGVFHKNTSLSETTWGTREFAFYDPYKNGLTFYRDL